MRKILMSLATMASLLAFPLFAASPPVKQSGSGICHDQNSIWYGRTKSFTAYSSMGDCLASGRAYKGYKGSAAAPQTTSTQSSTRAPEASGYVKYDRKMYDHWIDLDGDCQNTRQELLQELSTGRVTMAANGCTVVRGRWNDPYTGEVYMNARDLDIDHMVPLAYAHARGGYAWDAATKRKFANDPINTFAVQASANRQKGAKGPLEWLPPNKAYQCEYVTRFHRIMLTYKLQYADWEKGKIDNLRASLCAR